MVYVPTMLISGAIECALMAALAPPIALTLDKAVLSRGKKRRAAPDAVTDKFAPAPDAVADTGLCAAAPDRADGGSTENEDKK